jgi:hypothetical protein
LTFDVSVTASLRYEDGKTLKGMGTRASKSRLPGVAAFLLENLPNCSRTVQEEDKKELLGSGEVAKKVLGERKWEPCTRQLCLF